MNTSHDSDPIVIKEVVEDIFFFFWLCVPIFVCWRLLHPLARRRCYHIAVLQQ